MALVEVLMSTYNGERHLREQVDSILAQEGVDVRLVVRDDGSRDSTVEILRSYAADPRVVVVEGGNLGLPDAFFRLIQDSGADADYWALADQDDVWLPHKLSRAVARLRTVDGPALYCARVLVVDENLHPLYAHALPMRGPSFANALVQNIATGCTIVLDPLARAVLRDRWPQYAVMHDAWLYLVISATGAVVYDAEVVVHYRQHAENAIGVGRSRVSRVAGRVRRQLSPGGAGAHGRQNVEFLRSHGENLRPAGRATSAIPDGSGGIAAPHRQGPSLQDVHRQTFSSDIVRRGLSLLGRL